MTWEMKYFSVSGTLMFSYCIVIPRSSRGSLVNANKGLCGIMIFSTSIRLYNHSANLEVSGNTRIG